MSDENPFVEGESSPPPVGDNSGDTSYRVTADELRQFVERVERLEGEKRNLQGDIKEVFAEAKVRGYDVKIMRKLLAERKRDKNDVAEEQAVLEMYREALGM